MDYWRREWDSNPRYALTYTRFPSVRLKPLGHPSIRSPILSPLRPKRNTAQTQDSHKLQRRHARSQVRRHVPGPKPVARPLVQ